MSKLRDAARGQECQVRLPGICNRDNQTTILAHYRLAGTCGMGIKPVDLAGAWCCSACHDGIDGRIKTGFSREILDLAHAEGIVRTLYQLYKKGLLK